MILKWHLQTETMNKKEKLKKVSNSLHLWNAHKELRGMGRPSPSLLRDERSIADQALLFLRGSS